MYGKGLRPLSIAAVVLLAAGLSLVFFYAPIETDQGFIQKIFYLHVPLAITPCCTCAAATANGTPTRTSRSTSR
jgi:heme exporter protein C